MEKENEVRVEELSLKQLDEVAGGLAIANADWLKLIKAQPIKVVPRDFSALLGPGHPRLMNALPSDLIDLVESLDGEEENA